MNSVTKLFQTVIAKLANLFSRKAKSTLDLPKSEKEKHLDYESFGIPSHVARLPQKEILIWMIENKMAPPKYTKHSVSASLYVANLKLLRKDPEYLKLVQTKARNYLPPKADISSKPDKAPKNAPKDFYSKNEIPSSYANKTRKALLLWMAKNGHDKPQSTGCSIEQSLHSSLYGLLKKDDKFRKRMLEIAPSWFEDSKYALTKPSTEPNPEAKPVAQKPKNVILLRPKKPVSDLDMDLAVMKEIRTGVENGRAMSITRISHQLGLERVVVSRSVSRLVKAKMLFPLISNNQPQMVHETLRLTDEGNKLIAS